MTTLINTTINSLMNIKITIAYILITFIVTMITMSKITFLLNYCFYNVCVPIVFYWRYYNTN